MEVMHRNRKTRPGWEPWEVELLQDRDATDAELAEKLPRRTVRSINQMRRRGRITAKRKCVFCGAPRLAGRNTLYCAEHRHVYSSWFSVSYSAKIRGIEFALTLQDFERLVWHKPCVYCGEVPTGYGCDRYDNTKGYVVGNVVPCCFRCNRMKGPMGINEWVQRMRTVLERIDSVVVERG